jgi:hypothetical protein
LLDGRPNDGRVEAKRAIELAKTCGASQAEAVGLTLLALDRFRSGDPVEARRLFEDATRVCQQIGDRSSEAQALLYLSEFETPAAKERMLRELTEMCRAAGALRLELMARQLWVDALWAVDLRAQARSEARVLSREAARRSLRQTASIIELQCGCWAAQEADWDLVRAHRDAANRWGATTGAVPERAFAAAFDVLLALTEGDHAQASFAFARLEAQAAVYNEPTFGDLLRRAAAFAEPELARRLRERATPIPC